jgi:hypothetical protein
MVPAPRIKLTTFVVVQVRQALQQTGTAGPYSAAFDVIGAIRTESRCNMLRLYAR